MNARVNTENADPSVNQEEQASTNNEVIHSPEPPKDIERQLWLASTPEERQQLLKESAANPTQEEFSEAAGSPQEFDKKINVVYGNDVNSSQLERLRQNSANGDFSDAPEVEFIDGANLQGASGAYDQEGNIIYIDRSLAGTEEAQAVYSEEFGHYVDGVINDKDTQGDEGELFNAVFNNEELSEQRIASMRMDNDHGVIMVDGEAVAVEFKEGAEEVDIPSLNGASPEKLETVSENIEQLQTGDFDEQLSAIATLSKELKPKELPALLKELGIQDKALVKLVNDDGALSAVATLLDENSSNPDKLVASVTIISSLGDVAPDKVTNIIKPALDTIPGGKKVLAAAQTLMDPDKTALEKFGASIDLLTAIKDTAGDAFPKIANTLRLSESLTDSLKAAATLLDPASSAIDKSKALLALSQNAPDISSDLKQLTQLLTSKDIDNADELLKEVEADVVTQRLPEELKSSLDPKVIDGLSIEDADRLIELHNTEGLTDDLVKTLDNLTDPKSVANLLNTLESAGDEKAQGALLKTLGGLKPGVADDILLDPKTSALLVDTIGKLGPESYDNFAKVLNNFDKSTLDFFLKAADTVDGPALDKLVGNLEKVDGKLITNFIKSIDAVVSKAGITFTKEIGQAFIKGFGKAIPIGGAIPATYDAGKLATIAVNQSLPAEVRFLAAQGIKTNGLDAILSLAEPIVGPLTGGLAVGADIALAVASLGIELVVTDQLAKYNDNPSGYESPEWLDTVNVSVAALQGPAGAADLIAYYGPEGAGKAVLNTVKLGGKAALEAGVLANELAAKGVNIALHETAEGLHVLADMIRNPEKYGEKAQEYAEDAIEKLNELAEGVGELADEAKEVLGDTIEDLKELGEKGIEQLEWVAQNPGEAGKAAVEAIGNVIENGIEAGGEAAIKAGLAALEGLKAAGHIAGDVKDLIDSTMTDAVNKAKELGEDGLEALGWIAQNPGEAATLAKDALVDVVSQAGDLAEAAYDEIAQLGDEGLALAEKAVDNLVDAGEAGVDALKYIAENPSEAFSNAADAAIDGLASIAESLGDGAKAAGEALSDLASNGYDRAKDALNRIGEAWKSVSESVNAVSVAAADVGSAVWERTPWG